MEETSDVRMQYMSFPLNSGLRQSMLYIFMSEIVATTPSCSHQSLFLGVILGGVGWSLTQPRPECVSEDDVVLQYPVFAAATLFIMTVGRVIYFQGYSTGNPKNRLKGSPIFYARQLAQWGGLLYAGIKLLLGKA